MTDRDDDSGCCTTTLDPHGAQTGVSMPPPVQGPRQVPDHAVQVPGMRLSAPIVPSLPMMAGGLSGGLGSSRSYRATSITNAEFERFVEATGHVSEAER